MMMKPIKHKVVVTHQFEVTKGKHQIIYSDNIAKEMTTVVLECTKSPRPRSTENDNPNQNI